MRRAFAGVIPRAMIVVALLSGALLLAFQLKDVSTAPQETADVTSRLPDAVGEWAGEDIWYCQSESCAKSFRQSELKAITNCPSCDARLDQVSLGERTLLPADTIILRKVYRNSRGNSVVVSIVISGADQKSIHRPQQCLPAQGYAIGNVRTLQVPLVGRSPLDLTVISSKRGRFKMVFAYWFMGGGHETHDHFKRLALMAWDNIYHGIRARWAYVSVQTDETAGAERAERMLGEFIRQLYPLIRRVHQ